MSAGARPNSAHLPARILVVRLGAMGDIIHTLPAVASLKRSFPEAALTWAVEPQWAPLLEANPFVNSLLLVRRHSLGELWRSFRELRAGTFDLAIDFQGLIKSALTARAARPQRLVGFERSQVRERAAALFYSDPVLTASAHVIDRNIDLALAAGARDPVREFPLPPGRPEGDLPAGAFVLASPLAGWRSKQWPVEHYRTLAGRLAGVGVPLVLNLPPATNFPEIANAVRHASGLSGLIDGTRRAAAVVGVDSGPLHLAAALGRPGVAIFGPTDPARNGPPGDTIQVLRSPAAVTSYKRGDDVDPSMAAIGPDEVFDCLRTSLRTDPAGLRA